MEEREGGGRREVHVGGKFSVSIRVRCGDYQSFGSGFGQQLE